MKRTEIINLVSAALTDHHVSSIEELSIEILKRLEEAGMGAPMLKGLMSEAISRVYMYPDYRMWDEEFFANERLVKEYKMLVERQKKKSATPKPKFEHYYMCSECATSKGGVFPEGHVCTVMSGTCEYCNKVDVTLIPWVDFNWPLNTSLNAAANSNRD